jgi:hypothetical protein
MTTAGQQANQNMMQGGRLPEPRPETSLHYETMKKLPVDNRGTGCTASELETLNRVGRDAYGGGVDNMPYGERAAQNYIERCGKEGITPDPEALGVFRGFGD